MLDEFDLARLSQLDDAAVDELLVRDEGRPFTAAIAAGLADAAEVRRGQALDLVLWLLHDIQEFFDNDCMDRRPATHYRVISRLGATLGDRIADTSREVRSLAVEVILALARLVEWRGHFDFYIDWIVDTTPALQAITERDDGELAAAGARALSAIASSGLPPSDDEE